MRVITIGLLGHSAGSENLGVGALTVANLAILRDVARDLGIEARFVLFAWRERLENYLGAPDVELITLRVREAVSPWGRLAREIARCDIVLDIGGGDSFADIYGRNRFLTQILTKTQALIAGKPLVLSPQTLGPFDRGWSRVLARAVLRRAALVCSRDAMSVAYLREIGFDGPVVQATDVALRLPYTPPAPRTDGRVRVGVNVSGLLFNGGYSKDNMFKLGVDYPELNRRILGMFADRPECEVYLVPHVISDVVRIEDDRAVSRQLVAEDPRLRMAPDFANPSAAKSFIAGLDFFTGARMHACIAAFSSGVPVVPLAYSRKFAGLFDALGYPHVADCRTDSAEVILEKLASGFDGRAALQATIGLAMAEGARRLALYSDAVARCLR